MWACRKPRGRWCRFGDNLVERRDEFEEGKAHTVPKLSRTLSMWGAENRDAIVAESRGKTAPQSPTVGHDSFNTVPVFVKSKSTGLASIRLDKNLQHQCRGPVFAINRNTEIDSSRR